MRFPYRPYLIYEPGYILGAIFVSWLVGLPVILPLALIAGVFWKKSAYKTKTPPIIEDIFIWPQTAERGTRKQFKIPVRRAGNIGKVEQLYTLDIPPETKSTIIQAKAIKRRESLMVMSYSRFMSSTRTSLNTALLSYFLHSYQLYFYYIFC
jgi:hypothetical protein